MSAYMRKLAVVLIQLCEKKLRNSHYRLTQNTRNVWQRPAYADIGDVKPCS